MVSVFISYRRDGGYYLARVISDDLEKHNYDVFMDVHDLGAGEFEHKTLFEIAAHDYFVIVLTAGSIDRMRSEDDWLRRELLEAFAAERTTIIPLLDVGFRFDAPDVKRVIKSLPEPIRGISALNGVQMPSVEYSNAGLARLRQFLVPKSGDPPARATPEDSDLIEAQATLRAYELPAATNLSGEARRSLSWQDVQTELLGPTPGHLVTPRLSQMRSMSKLEWTKVPGAVKYVLQKDNDSRFGSPEIVYEGAGTSFISRSFSVGPFGDPKACYRVKAVGNPPLSRDSDWSNVVTVEPSTETETTVGSTYARQRSSGRVVWSILWALLPLLSLGLLIPAPFIHAAIRLRTRPQWLFAAVYVALWVVAMLAMLESGEPSFWVVLMVIATVHAFVLRPRVFSPMQAPPSAVPHFGVVALGIAGSGKTLYLSSMFHTVNVPTLERSYFLETSASHRIYLKKVFDELSDTAEPWPRATRTGETRQLDFDCASFDEGVKHLVFKISFLDYAGELLESEQEAGSTALNDLEERIRTAHGLLGMLDGYRVLQFLRNEPAGRRYFRSSIQPMTGIMAGASCPIHFVLTKWDLIRSFGEPADADDNLRLSLVKEALMETTQLKALVDTHSWAGQVIRLIPVSAVGPDFAQLDQDGRVLKRPDGELHPTNIEVPLTAILPDLFRQVELSLDAHTRQQVASEAQSRGSRFSMQRFLRLPAGAALWQRLQDVIGGPAGQEVVGMFLDWMAGVSTEESQAAREASRKGKQVAASVEAARARVMTEFAKELRGLEDRLPASRLSGW